MILSFYGAAENVTGSKHLLTLENKKRILLDCGMFQGKGPENDRLNREFGFEPQSVNYLVLSHAHIDHSGLIPRLVREGFAGRIFCTPPTLELCQLLLMDSARIAQSQHASSPQYADGWQSSGWQSSGWQSSAQPSQADEGPLYSEEDVIACLALFETVPYNTVYAIDEDIELLFTDTGHVLGSAAVNLSLRENGIIRKVCFSGDIGRFENRILNAPQPFPQAEIIICESTYGNKFHSSLENTERQLKEIIEDTCVNRGGKLLIPAFSIGRTQELIYSLNCLAEDGRLPNVKVFVDSPLSVYATDIMRKHPECFNEKMLEYIKTDPDPFGFPQLHYIVEADDSKLLNALEEPCVIISSSGMMEAGRIRNHLFHHVSDPRNTILVTGYCEPSTLGGKLINGAEKIHLFDQELDVKAEIMLMKEYSAHGDYGDIAKFLFCQEKDLIKTIFLVHGEKPVMEQLKKDLQESNYGNIEIPSYRISYEV